MTEENVFHWDTDELYREGLKKLPKWARESGATIDYTRPEIV